MGYTLQFYALSAQNLKKIFSSHSEDLFRRIHKRVSQSSEMEIALRKIIYEMSVPERMIARYNAEEVRPISAVTMEVLNMIVEEVGSAAGAIHHSSQATQHFQEVFLKEARKALGIKTDLSVLLSRPLFGLQASEMPSWGGLSREELIPILKLGTKETLPYLEDADSASMLFDLFDALLFVAESEKDLVTLYF